MIINYEYNLSLSIMIINQHYRLRLSIRIPDLRVGVLPKEVDTTDDGHGNYDNSRHEHVDCRCGGQTAAEGATTTTTTTTTRRPRPRVRLFRVSAIFAVTRTPRVHRHPDALLLALRHSDSEHCCIVLRINLTSLSGNVYLFISLYINVNKYI